MARRIRARLVPRPSEAGLSGSRIAATQGVSRNSAGEVLAAAREAGVGWRGAEATADAAAGERLFPGRGPGRRPGRGPSRGRARRRPPRRSSPRPPPGRSQPPRRPRTPPGRRASTFPVTSRSRFATRPTRAAAGPAVFPSGTASAYARLATRPREKEARHGEEDQGQAGAEWQYRALDGAVPNRDIEGANERDYSPRILHLRERGREDPAGTSRPSR